MKKIATPTSIRAVNAPNRERPLKPLRNATCVTSTTIAARARNPSKHGKVIRSGPRGSAALSRPPTAASVMAGDATCGPRDPPFR